MPKHQYFVIYKPFGMLNQFSGEATDRLLGELFNFPKDVYPIGRLDKDSEGLLVLTNDKTLNNKLLNPKFNHHRTYWVQVEGSIHAEALQQLSRGVTIRVNKKNYRTKLAEALALEHEPEAIPERNPPIRFRKTVPTSWLSLALTEGKNRQVRRMTAAVGFPTLRLIRAQIGSLSLQHVLPHQVIEMDKEEISQLLFSK